MNGIGHYCQAYKDLFVLVQKVHKLRVAFQYNIYNITV